MYRITIDSNVIPDYDVITNIKPPEEKLEYDFNKLISSETTITLNNINAAKLKYDDEIDGSIFYGSSWYNKSISIEDTDTGVIVWNGRIRNVKKTDSNGRVEVTSVSYVKDIIDAECVLVTGSTTDVTPATIIYTLLSTVVGIPTSAINKTSFDTASVTQAANNGYLIINYTQGQNIKCSDAIAEILRITSSNLYLVNNIIYYSQKSVYTGSQNTQIDESMIFPLSFSSEFDSSTIYNSFYIAYKSGTSVVYQAPTSTPTYASYSQTTYGVKTFTVPNKEGGISTSSTDNFKLLIKYQAGALYYGTLAVSLNHMPKKIAKIDLKKSLANKVYLNNFLDITYKHLLNEPVRVIERKLDAAKMSLSVEFLNKPYPTVVRDMIKPAAVNLVSVKSYIYDTIEIAWTPSRDAGFYAYQIEFSSTLNTFKGAYCEQGFSPILITSPTIKDGLCTYQLSGFENVATYYFRIRVIDTARNISDPSNVVEYVVNPLAKPDVAAQLYHCEGDLLTTLSFKDGVGVAPAGYTTYDDFNYDTTTYGYAGVYLSDILTNTNAFKTMQIKSNQTADYFIIQYRSYTDGIYGTWQDFVPVFSNNYMCYAASNINYQYIQIRVIYNIPYLYPTYTLQIIAIN